MDKNKILLIVGVVCIVLGTVALTIGGIASGSVVAIVEAVAVVVGLVIGIFGFSRMQTNVVIKGIDYYKEAENIGYAAVIETIDGLYWVGTDGKITKPSMAHVDASAVE